MSRRGHQSTEPPCDAAIDALPIGWERAHAIFGNANPPDRVWQRQFDGFDDALKRLASTPQRQIDTADLWYYFHDLAYQKLQPELFAYLFPVCLMDWHTTLRKGEACGHGDAEFHHGVWNGRVFDRMLSEPRRERVYAFFHDAFLEHIDSISSIDLNAVGWIWRLNSLARIMPRIDSIWNTWWTIETVGRALAAIEYISAIIYMPHENPLLSAQDRESSLRVEPCLARHQERVPDLYCHDSGGMAADAAWLEENLAFLTNELTFEYLVERMDRVVARLDQRAPFETAARMRDDLIMRREDIELRLLDHFRWLAP